MKAIRSSAARYSLGFSLIEFAIVLVIIGMVTGAVIGGKELIHAAKLRGLIAEAQKHMEAAAKFEKTYGALPGDITNIDSFFPGETAAADDPTLLGNGRIDTDQEKLLFWRHLAKAGLIEGSYDGVTEEPGKGMPKAAIDNTAYRIASMDGFGMAVEIVGFEGATADRGVMTPEDAWSIDAKYDDGDPTTGKIRGVDGNGAGSCFSGTSWQLTETNITCALMIAGDPNADDTTKTYDTVTCGADTLGASRTSATACPTGYTGRILETCQSDGTWKESSRDCKLVACADTGTTFQQRITIPCADGYEGTGDVYLCEISGVSTRETSGCVPREGTGDCEYLGTTYPDGMTYAIACGFGETGSRQMQCVSGSPLEVSNGCAAATCDGQNVGDTRVSPTYTCPNGMTGDIIEACSNLGLWVVSSNNCTGGGTCDSSTDTTKTENCPTGQVGTINMQCVAGTPDTWQVISMACSGDTCDGKQVGTIRASNTVICPAGFVGQVYEICMEDGGWDASFGQCVEITCPVGYIFDSSTSTCVGCSTALPVADNEARVNTATAGDQQKVILSPMSDGGYVAFWASNGQDGGGWGVYGQRYDDEATKVGAEFRINTTVSGDQDQPAATLLAGGNTVVAWTGNGPGDTAGLFAQLYNSSLTTIGGEVMLNESTVSDPQEPHLATLASGNFVAVWRSDGQDGDQGGIFGRIFTSAATAVGPEFAVNTTLTGNQRSPRVTPLLNGNFIVVWEDDSGGNWDIRAQRFSPTGTKLGSEFLVHAASADSQIEPDVITLDTGNWVVAWAATNVDGSFDAVQFRRFDPASNALGAAVTVNSTTTDRQHKPRLAKLVSGNFAVTWQSNTQDGDGYGIYTRIFTAAGVASSTELRSNEETAGDQDTPAITALTNGNAVVAWESAGQDGADDGIYQRSYKTCTCADGDDYDFGTNSCDPPPSCPVVPVISTSTVNPTTYADGTRGFALNGILAGDHAGQNLGVSGDINGDGTADIFVGASWADPNGANSGQAYVFFGGLNTCDGASDELSSLLAANGGDGTKGIVIHGKAASGYLGEELNYVGDVNGDGIGDFVVSAPSYNGGKGTVYLFFGKTDWTATPELNLATLVPDGVSVVEFPNSLADGGWSPGLGRTAHGVGDVNGDGFGDLAIAAPYQKDGGENEAGRVYVIYGKSAADWAAGGGTVNPATALDGTTTGVILRNTWWSVNPSFGVNAADVNGDGVNDLLVATHGATLIIFGGAANLTAAHNVATYLGASACNGTNCVALYNEGFNTTSNGFNNNSDAAGDINGDGYKDIIIGAVDEGQNGYDGTLYIIFGRSPAAWAATGGYLDVFSKFLTTTTTQGIRVNGTSFAGGYSIHAGDFNNDGFSDIVFGEGVASWDGTSEGNYKAWMIYGKASWSSQSTLNVGSLGSNGITFSPVRIGNASSNLPSGGGADVNNDKYPDITLGAFRADPGGRVDAGIAYTIFGFDSTGTGQLSCQAPYATYYGAGTQVDWTTGGRTHGQSVTVKCADGYMGGTSSVTCVDGTWQGAGPTCIAGASCTVSSLTGYDSATMKPAGNTVVLHGASQTISCKNGNYGVPTTPTCDNGTWMDIAPTCTTMTANWVAVGGNNQMAASTDGITWVPLEGAFSIRSLAYDGFGTWVGAGAGGKFYSSPDGLNWTEQTGVHGTSDVYEVIHDDTYGGLGTWVAVGAAGKVSTSSDGTTWTIRDSRLGTSTIRTVGYNPQPTTPPTVNWVVVGAGGKLAYSTSGATWTTVDAGFGASAVRGVAYNGNGLWVAVGESGKIATSSDGITWTQQAAILGGSNVMDVQHNMQPGAAGRWVAVGASGKIAYSSDGITWNNSSNSTNAAVFAANQVNSIDHNWYAGAAGVWVAAANTGKIATSTDGDTWTRRYNSGPNIVKVLHPHLPENDTWIAAASGCTHTLASTNQGVSWANTNAGGCGTVAGFGFNGLGGSRSLFWYDAAGNAHYCSANGTNWTTGCGWGVLDSDSSWAEDPGNVLTVALSDGNNGSVVFMSDATNDGSSVSLGWGGNRAYSIAYRHQYIANFVMAGDGGKIAISENGKAWLPVTGAHGTSAIYSVAHNNSPTGAGGLWVAVGDEGKVSTSADGVTWVGQPSLFGGCPITKVVFDEVNNQWAIFSDPSCNGMNYALSNDASTWTEYDENASGDIYGITAAEFNNQAAGAGMWVIGGNEGDIASSSDGLDWEQRVTEATYFDSNILDIAYKREKTATCPAKDSTPIPHPTNISYAANGNGYTLIGEGGADTPPPYGDEAGFSVSLTGDVNDDGVADMVIGAPHAGTAGANAGRVYVVFGGLSSCASNSFNLTDLLAINDGDGSKGFVVEGLNAGDALGVSAQIIGDVNGDGIADIGIGAPGYGNTGRAYILFGRDTWPAEVDLTALDGTNGAVINAYNASAGQYFGFGISGLGDMNGDGIDDFGINTYSGSSVGRLYIIFGKNQAGWTSTSGTFNTSGITSATGYTTSYSESRFFTAAGDVNGDGYGDAVIAAHNSNSAHLIFGKANWATPPSAITFTKTGQNMRPVGGVGDVNGDGYDDFIISTRTDNVPALIWGRSTADWAAIGATFSINTRVPNTPGEGIYLSGPGNNFGTLTAHAGDFNNDGFSDILLANNNGGWPAQTTTSRYILYGKLDWSATPTPYNIASILNGATGFEIQDVAGNNDDWEGQYQFGQGGGDVNNDRFDDIILGAWKLASGGTDSGGAHVLFGWDASATGFKACGAPKRSAYVTSNGVPAYTGTYQHNQTQDVDCALGYTGGPFTITCDDGVWTGAINCALGASCTLSTLTGYVEGIMLPAGSTSTTSGQTETVSCAPGYTGVATTPTCNNGVWVGIAPTCTLSTAYWIAVGDGGKIAGTGKTGTVWSNITGTHGTDAIHDVAFNGLPGAAAQWVAVGAEGNLSYSSTGLSWTAAAAVHGSDAINGIAHNHQIGNAALWVAVGDGGILSTSSDGITWTVQADQHGASRINAVAHNTLSGGSGLWVAVGEGGIVSYSSAGSVWAAAAVQHGGDEIYSVAHNGKATGGLWMIVGANGKVSTSSNGSAWTAKTAAFGGCTIHSVRYNHGSDLFEISGDPACNGNNFATSTDGTAWTESAIGGMDTALSLANNSLAAPDMLVYAGGSGGDIFSYNGTSWTEREPDATLFTSGNVRALAYREFQPDQLSGLLIWLDGHDPNGTGVLPANGATIQNWIDKQGGDQNGSQATAGNRATYVASSLGGKGGMSFDGADRYNITLTGIANTSYTIVALIQRGDNSANRPLVGTASDGVNRTLSFGASTNTNFRFDQGTNALDVAIPGYAAATPVIVSGRLDTEVGHSVRYLVNGVTLSSGSNANVTPLSTANTGQIGRSICCGSYLGTINELLIFNRALTDSELLEVEAYLRRKFGL